MMKRYFLWIELVLLMLLLVPTALGQFREKELGTLTPWTGKNGVTIEGYFQYEKDGIIYVHSGSKSGRMYKLDPKNLSEQTLEWYKRKKKERDKKSGKEKGDPFGGAANGVASQDGFQRLSGKDLDRSDISPVDPTKYGLRANSDGMGAFVPFFVWWDSKTALKIPKGREQDDRIEWVCKELNKRLDRNNNYLGLPEDFKKAFTKYFDGHFKGEVTFSLSSSKIFDPAGLPAAAKGSQATLLRMMVFSGKKKQWYFDSSLVGANADGGISFIAFNEMVRATVNPLTVKEAKALGSKSHMWEVKLLHGENLPERLKRMKDVRLLLDQRTALYILTPMVKAGALEDKR